MSIIKKVIESSPNTSCELDPVLMITWLLKPCLHELLPILTKIVNILLETDHAAFKSTYAWTLLKNPNLDQNTLNNYRPVPNLPFVSRILEDHRESNDHHEEYKAVYRKFHFTETAQVQNDILLPLDQNKVTILRWTFLLRSTPMTIDSVKKICHKNVNHSKVLLSNCYQNVSIVVKAYDHEI